MKNRFLISLAAIVLLGIGIVWWLSIGNQEGLQAAIPILGHSSPTKSSLSPAVIEQTSVPIPTPTKSISIGPYVSQLGPTFSLESLAGKSVSPEDYRGNVVLLNFWASWCIPCKEEMPVIQAAYEKYRDQGLVVLGINMTNQDDRGAVETFIQDAGVTFPILLDEDGTVSEAYRVISIPTSFLVDRSGVIRHFQLGAMTAKQLEQYLEAMLKD